MITSWRPVGETCHTPDGGRAYRERVQAAFFDLDKTVIAKAALMAFGRPLHNAGYISRWLVLRSLYGQLVFRYFGADEARMKKMRETSLRLAKGWDQAKVMALVRETLTEVIEPIVYEEALDLIDSHRNEGHRVFIVSASPFEIVTPLAQYLGVDSTISTRAEIDDQGRYTGGVEFYAYGPYKAQALRELAATDDIDLAESFAYSDSITDLPMLEAVGHPVVVNPDRELRRIAIERGWEIRTFTATVALKTRNHVRPVAIGSGTVALAGAAAATWWYLRRGKKARRFAGWR
jgi:HAD superfamily hydrolase (TIGR01490 family)